MTRVRRSYSSTGSPLVLLCFLCFVLRLLARAGLRDGTRCGLDDREVGQEDRLVVVTIDPLALPTVEHHLVAHMQDGCVCLAQVLREVVVVRRSREGLDLDDQPRDCLSAEPVPTPPEVLVFDECAAARVLLVLQRLPVDLVDVLEQRRVVVRLAGLGVSLVDDLEQLAQFEVLRDRHGVVVLDRTIGVLCRARYADAGVHEGQEPGLEVIPVRGQLGQEQDRTAHLLVGDLPKQLVLCILGQPLEHAVADAFEAGELLGRSDQQRGELFASVVPFVLQSCLGTLAETGRAGLEQ